MYYVYLLKGERYYIGYTNNLERRLEQHKNGHTFTTKRIGSFELIGYFMLEDKLLAINLERELKKNGHYERITEKTGFVKIIK